MPPFVFKTGTHEPAHEIKIVGNILCLKIYNSWRMIAMEPELKKKLQNETKDGTKRRT
jgi:hypothetical protein